MPEMAAIRAALYTVPFGQDFCDSIVTALQKKCGSDPLALNEALILLPNNRAIKAMTEAFVRKAKPGLLLPKMAAIGDLALDEALGAIIDPLDAADDDRGTTILPAIEPITRLSCLANLVAMQKRSVGKAVSATQAVRMARQLAATIDELNVEQIDYSGFPTLNDDHDLAGHWQNAYGELLAIWPLYLAELARMGVQDATHRRNQLLDRLARRIGEKHYPCMIIAAGISTAAPAIARVLRAIALQPQNMVVLPNVDLEMPDSSWGQLRTEADDEGAIKSEKEGHPQYHLKLLLDRMGFQRGEIKSLGVSSQSTTKPISDIFCLPDETAGWLALPAARKKMKHLRAMIAEDSAEEALAISILVREALAKPAQRIAIVTADRELARRVSSQLKRWDINVDDSAGIALLQTANGTLFKSLMQAVAERFAPNRLLAILQHPLVHAGEHRLQWLEHVRALDLALRGPSIGIGLHAITQRIGQEIERAKGPKQASLSELADWWAEVAILLSPLDMPNEHEICDLLPKAIAILDGISDGLIWQGANGRELAAYLEAIEGSGIGALAGQQREAVSTLIESLFEGQVVRPAFGGHPRVAIFGLLEARLQQADIIICAGLNEGTWPQAAQPDPWLAPIIRRTLGLSGFDRNVGLSAHDLATFMGASEVVLTRAKRDRAGPTVASRFLLRLEAFLGQSLQTETVALEYARRIDIGTPVPSATRPMPMPSRAQRAIELSVTDFDRLKSDPFAIYARKILKLEPLDAVDTEPDAAWQGTIIHDILEKWANQHDCDPAQLVPLAKEFLDSPAIHPTMNTMWQPRILNGLEWVAEETERLKHEEGRTWALAEEEGRITLSGVKIKGRVDRIDTLAGGGTAVIDYKSGGVPSGKQVFNGFALQLGLLGLMLREGGFGKPAAEPKAFEYWTLAKRSGGVDFGSIKKVTTDKPNDKKILANEFVDFVRQHAAEALGNWINGDAPFTAKLHPEYHNYQDFDQLSRLAEWDGRQPVDGEDLADG